MAHKRKGRKEIRKPPRKKEEKTSGVKVIIVILIAAALVLVPITLLLSSEETSNNGPEPPPFEISFPRDEGQHNESLEFWKVDFSLKNQASNRFDINVDYYLHETGDQERVVSITDEGNISGREFFYRAHNGTLGIGFQKLNLSFVSSSGSDTWSGEYSAPYQYSYQGEVLDAGNEVCYLDLQMTSIKDPLLLGDEGIIYLESGGNAIGTIKGYMITRLSVSGTMRLEGTTYIVTGYAWIEHEWGAWTSYNMEELRLHLSTASELFLLRFFDSEDSEIIKQVVYYSKPGGEVLELGSDDFQLTNLRYWIDPRFQPSDERCIPSRWRFDSDTASTDILLHSSVSNQIEKYHWEGSLTVSGTIDGLAGTGRGFAIMNHPYYSTPEVVSFHRDDMIPTEPKLYLNVTNQIPMDNATLHYQINNGSWESVPMTNLGSEIWMATIYVSVGDSVKAYAEAYDLAGKRVISDPPMTWTV